MGAGFTPGPWRAVGAMVQAGAADTHDRVTIAECDGGPIVGGDIEPNARLIAAAPELLISLEALRVAIAALAARIDEEMDLDNHDKPNWAMRLGSEFGDLIGRADRAAAAACAKARGT